MKDDANWKAMRASSALIAIRSCNATTKAVVGKMLESAAENRVLRDESKLSGGISSRGRIQFVFEEFGATRLAEWQRMA